MPRWVFPEVEESPQPGWRALRGSVRLGYGISALHVCEGVLANGDPTGRHVVIDPYQETRFASCGPFDHYVDF